LKILLPLASERENCVAKLKDCLLNIKGYIIIFLSQRDIRRQKHTLISLANICKNVIVRKTVLPELIIFVKFFNAFIFRNVNLFLPTLAFVCKDAKLKTTFSGNDDIFYTASAESEQHFENRYGEKTRIRTITTRLKIYSPFLRLSYFSKKFNASLFHLHFTLLIKYSGCHIWRILKVELWQTYTLQFSVSKDNLVKRRSSLMKTTFQIQETQKFTKFCKAIQ